MELKFGMSPFKTQQFSEDSVIRRKKPEQIKKELGKTGFEPSFGRWSFRMPKKNGEKNSIIKSEKNNKSKNTQFSTQLYDKNINAKHKVKDWLNEERRTPLRRSVSDLRAISRVPAFALILADRQESRVGTLLERKHEEAGLKDIEDQKLKTVVRKHGGATGEDSEPLLNIALKTKISDTQPKRLLRRSISDLKQKSIAARNFLNLGDVKENVCSSAVIQLITDNSNYLSDNDVEHDENDIYDNKENIVKDDKKQKDANATDQSRLYGSILKRPGIKRMNIKHVEFLDNVGDDEDNRVRYF